MRFASLLVSALFALSALAAPLPVDNGVATEGELQPTIISHQPHPAPNVSGAQLRARASIKGKVAKPAKAAAPAKKLVVPAVQQMKTHLKVSPGKVIFYSGPGGYIDKARSKGASMGGLKILEDSWKDKKFPDLYQASLPAAEMKKFWDNASVALAELSSGTVYVLLPANTVGTNFFPGTVWQRLEWNTLQKNGKVKKVVMVNPDNNNQEVIKGKLLEDSPAAAGSIKIIQEEATQLDID